MCSSDLGAGGPRACGCGRCGRLDVGESRAARRRRHRHLPLDLLAIPGPRTQATLAEAIELHGAAATAEAPLAWLRMEPAPGRIVPIELRLTLWPGGVDRRLAVVQVHGATVAWDG